MRVDRNYIPLPQREERGIREEEEARVESVEAVLSPDKRRRKEYVKDLSGFTPGIYERQKGGETSSSSGRGRREMVDLECRS